MVPRSSFLLSAAFLCCLTGFGQSQQSPVSASAQAPAISQVPPPFAVEIKKAVAFMETDCLKDGKIVPSVATLSSSLSQMRDLAKIADSRIWSRTVTPPNPASKPESPVKS
jgi:hypothetical protein